jgi:peptidoglycan hydrolase-like protein with peptidoglycan-binding domain
MTLFMLLPLNTYAFSDSCYEKYPYSMVLAMQAELLQRGFNPGPIDGKWGFKTRRAVNDFQVATGIRHASEIKGTPNGDTLRKLFGSNFNAGKFGLTPNEAVPPVLFEKYCK